MIFKKLFLERMSFSVETLGLLKKMIKKHCNSKYPMEDVLKKYQESGGRKIKAFKRNQYYHYVIMLHQYQQKKMDKEHFKQAVQMKLLQLIMQRMLDLNQLIENQKIYILQMQGKQQNNIKYYMNFHLHQKEKEWEQFYRYKDKKVQDFIQKELIQQRNRRCQKYKEDFQWMNVKVLVKKD
ncbi:unnamed protein product [Paramecium sonneborni]|uniref:Uncharacterized protein n=1 Tax=Paramecium sonneborni TaxID=65129 RepID=A0A8S1RW57_9CILI|nr:unnamed protein product [Paramecium sonneborni]